MKVPKNAFLGTIDYSSDCYDVIKKYETKFQNRKQETTTYVQKLVDMFPENKDAAVLCISRG